MDFESKLDELFIDLPIPPTEMGNTTSTYQVGKILNVCSVVPFAEGKVQSQGRVGIEVRLDMAKLAARTATILMLALVRRELGSLNSVKRILKLDVHIACGADFRDLGKVADGASELLTQIFGKYGKHARMCVGVTSLPGNACVMLNVEVETN